MTYNHDFRQARGCELRISNVASLNHDSTQSVVARMPDVLGDATNLQQATPARMLSTPAQKPAFSAKKSTPPSTSFQDRSQVSRVTISGDSLFTHIHPQVDTYQPGGKFLHTPPLHIAMPMEIIFLCVCPFILG
jgi:hypothetical protein